MTSEELLARFSGNPPFCFELNELGDVLEPAEIVLEENTTLSGMVRVLRVGDVYLVQEQTPDRTVLIRCRPTLEAATAFVEKRLQTYEKMWDG